MRSIATTRTDMDAPTEFCSWLSSHVANDHKYGRDVFRYHPRSDAHSRKLCELVLRDLAVACPVLARHLAAHVVIGVTNARYEFPSGKRKALDLLVCDAPRATDAATALMITSLGQPESSSLRVSVEAKQCMTEHGKTQPRIFDELSSSHEIVHQGCRNSIAGGIVVVNVATAFASPLRQVSSTGPLVVSRHRQPAVTEAMIKHLRGLKQRESPTEIGFDAFATVVVDCDNLGACRLHTERPAPQPGDLDHYATFISRLARAYESRFGDA